jgi:hypothetical protein
MIDTTLLDNLFYAFVLTVVATFSIINCIFVSAVYRRVSTYPKEIVIRRSPKEEPALSQKLMFKEEIVEA